MATPRLTDAFRSLSQSTTFLSSLTFTSSPSHSSSSPNILPSTVLSSQDFYESHLIRDAGPAELALFLPNAATTDFSALGEGGGGGGEEAWGVKKRRGPERRRVVVEGEGVSPRRKTQGHGGGGAGAVDEPDRCLRAAKKLLDIYTMPRATEHVFALHSQWVGVVDSISDLEESLRRPPSRPTPQAQHDDSYYRQLELEDAIRREEMELFAVEQIKAELEAKIAPAPAPIQPPPRFKSAAGGARKVPSVVANAKRAPLAKTRPRPSAPTALDDNDNLLAESSPVPLDDSLPSSAALEGGGAELKPTKRVPAVVAAAAASRLRPSTGAPPSSPARQPLPRRRPSIAPSAAVAAVAPASPSRHEGGGGAAADLSPKPSRTRHSPSAASSTPPPASAVAAPALPDGVTQPELDAAVKTIWTALGGENGGGGGGQGLRAWGARWAEEEGVDQARKERIGSGEVGVEETIEILRFALSTSLAAHSSGAPPSPSSGSITSFSTSTTDATSSPSTPPWSPAQIIESQLLLLFLTTLTSSPSPPSPPSSSPSLPPLTIILRDPLPTSSTPPGSKTPCLLMSTLKSHLGQYAKEKGWTEEMGTTAVYALVSKGVVRLCRRGREGAAVGIRT